MVNNTLANAITQPVVVNNIHESCFKASAVLDFVKLMLLRKDSHETILDFINTLYAKEFIHEEKLKNCMNG